MNPIRKKTHPKRRNARRFAVQAVYQWQFTHAHEDEVLQEIFAREDFSVASREYFSELVKGVITRSAELDAIFTPFLDRPITELNPIELAVLRLACFELLVRIDIPYRVVINEALELTKEFGTVEGYKYVNGVLDKIVQKVPRADLLRSGV